MSFDGISLENKQLSICHDKFSHFPQNCITLKNLFYTFYEKIDLSYLICEKLSIINGYISSSKSENYQSLLNPPMQLKLLLQKTEYYHKTGEY